MTGCASNGEDCPVNGEEWQMGEIPAELQDEGGVGGGGSGGTEMCMMEMAGGSYSKKRMRHINNERQRRILMNTLLDSLQALLPDPHPRKDRCALLTDVIAHVQSLEEEVQDLAARTTHIKKSMPKITHPAGTNISTGKPVTAILRNLHVQFINSHEKLTAASSPSSNWTEEIVITFTSSPIRGLHSHVLSLFQRNHMEVINASLSTTPDAQVLYYIHARVSKEHCLQNDDVKLLFSQLTFNEEDASYSLAFQETN
eukprot:c21169_g1_i1 orf=47-814(+)